MGRAVPALVAFISGLVAPFGEGAKKEVMKSEKNLHFYLFSVGHFYVVVFVKLLRENFVRLQEEAKQTSFGFLYTDSDAEAAGSTRKTWIARVLFLLRFTEFVNLEV